MARPTEPRATCPSCSGQPLLTHNVEAERSVLGALLVEGERLPEVVDWLRPAHFYLAGHQTIYDCLVRLAERQVRPDVVTVRNALATAGQEAEVGGVAYLSGLTDGLPRLSNLAYYAKVVRDHALRRAMILNALRTIQEARSAEQASEALAAEEARTFALSADVDGTHDLVEVTGLITAAGAVFDRLMATGRPVHGVETGLTDLDQSTRGLHAGQLVVAAARPGMGKTTLALNVARHAARTHTVLFVSVEMDREELAMRLLMSEAQQDGHAVLRGRNLTDAFWTSVSGAINRVNDIKLVVDDAPHRTVSQIRSTCRRLAATRKDLGLVVIDYLGLLTPDKSRREEKRHLELADMTRALKLMAKELRIPVLLLAQLNRDTDKRKGTKTARPRLSDLAESGAIEKDADQVWFIHQDPGDDDQHAARVIVAKNRSGPKAVVKVAYFEEQYRFANLIEDAEGGA